MRTRCIAGSIAAAATLAPSLHAQCPPVERAVITASDAHAQDQFGCSVAIDGDTAIVGARYNELLGATQAGAAYIYERNLGGPDAWGERKLLTPSDAGASAAFGWKVELDGDRAAVRRNWDPVVLDGSIYLFERDFGGPNAWAQRAKLIRDPSFGQSLYFGFGFDLQGDTLAAWSLATSGSQAGEIWIFERNFGGPDQWGNTTHFALPEVMTNSSFVASVSLDGDTLAVGDGYPYQTVYIYQRNLGGTGAWGWSQTIPAVSAQPGYFGWTVAVEGDTLLIGAPTALYNGGPQQTYNCGLVYVFGRPNSAAPFALIKALHPSVPNFDAFFGGALELAGGRAVVGASTDDAPGQNSGSAWIFERDFGGPGNWGERARVLASDGSANDYFGNDAAIDGDTVLVGAPVRGHGNGTNTGAAYVSLLPWSGPESYCTAGTSLNGCTASMTSTGSASASAGSGFTVSAIGVEGQRTGTLFFGISGPNALVWSAGNSSWRCVHAPYQRTGFVNSGGTAGTCTGTLSLDWNHYVATHPTCLGSPYLGGETVWMQAWYRDPNAASATQLSDGLRFSVCP